MGKQEIDLTKFFDEDDELDQLIVETIKKNPQILDFHDCDCGTEFCEHSVGITTEWLNR